MNLCSDDLVLTNSIPWRLLSISIHEAQWAWASGSTYVGVICQRIHGELGKRLRVLDEFEKVLPSASILFSGISYRLSPYGDVRILKQQECLHAAKLALPYVQPHPSSISLTFQHTERQPDKQGLDDPLCLTALRRSARLVQWLRVASQRVLCQWSARSRDSEPLPAVDDSLCLLDRPHGACSKYSNHTVMV